MTDNTSSFRINNQIQHNSFHVEDDIKEESDFEAVYADFWGLFNGLKTLIVNTSSAREKFTC